MIDGPAAAASVGLTAAVLVAAAAGAVLAGLRWLRVAQREHYLTGSVVRFARRWWGRPGPNLPLAAAGVAGAVASWWWPATALVTVAVVAVGPVGLGLRGRTAPLVWTRRLVAVAALAAAMAVAAVAVVAAVGGPAVVAAAAIAALTPVLVDAADAVRVPFETRRARRFAARAEQRLRQVAPTVVAITGSYGKTSTKVALAHLVAGTRTVVATPASFNNRAGLSRAVNEQLVDGTDVFVAEMGTYGPGEIAELCRFIPPDVAVITAIGPVHLERFRSEDRIVAAKSEILAAAPIAVLVVDDPRLAAVADRAEADGKEVRRVSTVDATADVSVVDGGDGTATVAVGGAVVGAVAAADVRPANLAAAVAAALAVGVPVEAVAVRLPTLPAVPHRLSSQRGAGGVLILDDTYNANPAGAAAGLARLAEVGAGGRRVVVTPGMVELGRRQADENRRFAAAAAGVCSDLVVVGRTNRAALRAGAAGSSCRVVTVATRDEAVAWVRSELGPGDAVLYENDLPDHYP